MERRGFVGSDVLEQDPGPVLRDSSDFEVSACSGYGPNIPSAGTSWFLVRLRTKRTNEASEQVRPMPF